LRKLAHALWIGRQAVIVVLAIAIYFGVRGMTVGATDTAREHARDIVSLERQLGIYIEPSIADPVSSSGTLATLANDVYIYGHWPVIVVTMLWLAWRHRPQFLELRDAMIVSGLLGMLIFVSYPVAPPRLAELGFVDTITERSVAYRVLQPPAFVNQYAAMPSLHAGWDLLVGIAIVSAASGLALRVIGGLLPVVMATSVMVTANHYLLDVVAGVILVLIGRYVAVRLQRRRDRVDDGTEPAAQVPVAAP